MRTALSKFSLAAVLIFGCQLSAQASFSSLGEISGTATFSNTTMPGAFLDFVTFSVASTYDAALVSTSIAMETYGPTLTSMNLFQGIYTSATGLPTAVSLPAVVSITEVNDTKFLTLASTAQLLPTDYTLVLAGTSKGTAAYTGIVSLTEITPSTPTVPEPESYAMLLAGLGMLGFIARRRQKNT